MFVALLVASLATTFYVIRDKTPDLMLELVDLSPRRFSPDGDGKRDTMTLRFFVRVDEPGARIEIINTNGGAVVKTLDADRTLNANVTVAYVWDGTRDGGRRMHNGNFRLKVTLPSHDRVIEFPRRFFLERK